MLSMIRQACLSIESAIASDAYPASIATSTWAAVPAGEQVDHEQVLTSQQEDTLGRLLGLTDEPELMEKPAKKVKK